MSKPYLLHAIAVHFPIALLLTGLAVAACSAWRPRPAWSAEAASWFLWLGTLSLWAALGLGVLADKTAPHVPPAWETLVRHETLAWWTAGAFTLLSAWRVFKGRRGERPQVAAWALGAALLVATAYHGGELVFTFGVGVGE